MIAGSPARPEPEPGRLPQRRSLGAAPAPPDSGAAPNRRSGRPGSGLRHAEAGAAANRRHHLARLGRWEEPAHCRTAGPAGGPSWVPGATVRRGSRRRRLTLPAPAAVVAESVPPRATSQAGVATAVPSRLKVVRSTARERAGWPRSGRTGWPPEVARRRQRSSRILLVRCVGGDQPLVAIAGAESFGLHACRCRGNSHSAPVSVARSRASGGPPGRARRQAEGQGTAGRGGIIPGAAREEGSPTPCRSPRQGRSPFFAWGRLVNQPVSGKRSGEKALLRR